MRGPRTTDRRTIRLMPPPTRQQLEAAHALEPGDDIRRKPEMTSFRRAARYHQAMWREARGHPTGTQPYAPRPKDGSRLVGSRIPLAYGRETGANFVTPAALAEARKRTSFIEPNQSFDHQRLWADLLSSEALAFNLFGDLAADPRRADRAIHTWWPDTPGSVAEVRFAHSPGRLDPAYLNSLRAWDTAFLLTLPGSKRGIVGVDVTYHESAKAETPKPRNLWRYVAVAEASGVFATGAIDRLKGRSEMAVMWLEHLLLLSMLQHPSHAWTWGRYVVVYPAANADAARLVEGYQRLLSDTKSFSAITLEEIVRSGALPRRAASAVRQRYLLR
jgi:hypothetical protein